MATIPFEKQRFPGDLVPQIENAISEGRPVSGDVLVDAIESYEGRQLPDRLRDIIKKFSVTAVKLRGRPVNDWRRDKYAFEEELDPQYEALLSKYEAAAKVEKNQKKGAAPRASAPPSELAYRDLAKNLRIYFPNIDWRTLRNKHSAWKNSKITEYIPVNSEDVYGEIDRLYPAPKDS